jgi:hypothetical protein
MGQLARFLNYDGSLQRRSGKVTLPCYGNALRLPLA